MPPAAMGSAQPMGSAPAGPQLSQMAAMKSAGPGPGLPAGIDPRAVAANPAGYEQWKQGAAQQAAMPMAGGPQPPGAVGGLGGTASMGPRPGMPPPMPGAPASGMLPAQGGFNQAPAQPMGGMQSMGQAQPMGGGIGGPQNMQAQQSYDQMMNAKSAAMNTANAPVTPAGAGMAGKVMPGAPIGRSMAMKKGGEVKLAKGGSVGGRGDGIAQRGKTRGRMV